MADIEKIKSAYQTAYIDIVQGKNLQKHLEDVSGAIEELGTAIADHRDQKGEDPQSMLVVKNELFRLKYMILEQI